jgi:mannose-6-phosphate isomerase
MTEPPFFDPSDFRIHPCARRFSKPWGWEIHWTPEDSPYVGKSIHIYANSRLSLQLHDLKQESWLLVRGQAKVVWENDSGMLVETQLVPGLGYTCSLGQRHRLVGITDCEIVEVSTQETGTTWRLEDDYSRPHETAEQRAKERATSHL